MRRPAVFSYVLVPIFVVILAVTVSCGESSNPMRSTESALSARVTQTAQPAPAGLPPVAVEPKHHGPNHPPVVNSPRNGTVTLLFPRGPAGRLDYSGEPATDPEGDDLSYRFSFAVPDREGIQTADEALLDITRTGNSFFFRPDGLLSPAEYASVYGNDANIPVVLSALYASDGKAESEPGVFSLNVVYDGSAQFSAPAEYVGEQRWETPRPLDWYEGTSEPVGGSFPTWTAVTGDLRNWKLDSSPSGIRCEIVTVFDPYTPPTGGDDNGLFVLNSEARSTAGTVRLAFRTAPDFENPGDSDSDNLYRLRVVNTHNIHFLNGEGSPTGCSGSLLDVRIRVKDVGVPAPPRYVNAEYSGTPENGDTMLEISWTDPGGFLENGRLVPFPAGFEVTDYDYRYRAAGGTAWTEEAEDLLTDTSVSIAGLTGDAYEVQVRANNSEGRGTWSPAIEVGRIVRTVSFGDRRYVAVQGGRGGAEVEVRLDPPAGSMPVTIPISVEEEAGTDTDDYLGVPPSVTFAPRESVQTFLVRAVLHLNEAEPADKRIRLTFTDLPSNVTAQSPAYAEVTLEKPPRVPAVVGLRISSTPEHGAYYGYCDNVEVEVVFDEPVNVSGKPLIWLEVFCPGWRKATYHRGSGSDTLYFRYRVDYLDFDHSGILVIGGKISLNGGKIASVSRGVDADTHHDPLPEDPNHKVDGGL